MAGLAKRCSCISYPFRCHCLNQIIVLSNFQSPERKVAVNGRNGIAHIFNN